MAWVASSTSEPVRKMETSCTGLVFCASQLHNSRLHHVLGPSLCHVALPGCFAGLLCLPRLGAMPASPASCSPGRCHRSARCRTITAASLLRGPAGVGG
jgi:hypothetical protein